MRHTLNLAITAFALLVMSGCSLWSGFGGTGVTRLSVPLGDPDKASIVASRPAWLQKNVVAMDDAAFGGARAPLALKLSYDLTFPVRKV